MYSGSQFVPGLLSSGVLVQLSKSIMAASNSYEKQMELEGMFLKGESEAALVQSNAVKTAEDKMSDVEMDQAFSSIYQGITQALGPVLTIGMRVYREKGLSIFGKSELSKIEEQGENVSQFKNLLHTGSVNIQSINTPKTPSYDPEENGIELMEKNKPANANIENATAPSSEEETAKVQAKEDEAADKLKKEKVGTIKTKEDEKNASEAATGATAKGELEAKQMLLKVRTADFTKSPKEDPELKGIIEKLHAFSTDKEEQTTDLGRKKELFDMAEKKIDKAEERVNKQRESYHGATDRMTSYLGSFTQASGSLAAGVKQKDAAEARKDQATADAFKAMAEYQTQSQKSAADMSLQSSQNSAQSISELARAKAEIAQANRM